MNDHTKSTADIFAHNDRLMRFALKQSSDEVTTRQMRGGNGSSISWVVGHLLNGRVAVLKMLGVSVSHPYQDVIRAGIVADYPGVSDLASEWTRVADPLHKALEGLTDDDVLTAQEGYPHPDQTIRGALMFRAWHESYHMGQIGLIGTEFGTAALAPQLRAQWQNSQD